MITAILQSRMGSTRLPGKSLQTILDKPMLWHVLQRLKQSKKVNQAVVATTIDSSDDPIEKLCHELGVKCFRGSVEDVLSRYVGAAEKFGGDIIVRVTADCPLLDAEVVDRVIEEYQKGGAEYVSNVHPPTFPDGLDVEVFSKEALMRAHREAALQSEREHVTPYIWKHVDKFGLRNVSNGQDLSALRWTVDEPADLAFVSEVYKLLQAKRHEHTAGMKEILELIGNNPQLGGINKGFVRNEGYAKSLKEDKKRE